MRTTYSGFPFVIFMLITFFGLTVQPATAQTFFEAASSSQLNLAIAPSSKPDKSMISEGAYSIKDGQLDEIYKLKLVLPALPDSILKDKKVTFEQTHVMVLPMMGMVHFVGALDVDGVKSTTSLQLGFMVNQDESISFKGTKSLKLSELFDDLPTDELKLTIDFVLKNNLAALTAK